MIRLFDFPSIEKLFKFYNLILLSMSLIIAG
ncbi:hypothetical protein Barb6XT_03092 [Bacteroidales bacterium Barb6XT]|nr:hypothetical protein Barb6XT_03092 [Bacteroidales bacterium Barb6XT]